MAKTKQLGTATAKEAQTDLDVRIHFDRFNLAGAKQEPNIQLLLRCDVTLGYDGAPSATQGFRIHNPGAPATDNALTLAEQNKLLELLNKCVAHGFRLDGAG
jgi:hypothetical protein